VANEGRSSPLSRRLGETLLAHKVWTVVAIIAVIALVQFLFLGIGLGSGDSGVDVGSISAAP
jgi:hypothetical protein